MKYQKQILKISVQTILYQSYMVGPTLFIEMPIGSPDKYCKWHTLIECIHLFSIISIGRVLHSTYNPRPIIGLNI